MEIDTGNPLCSYRMTEQEREMALAVNLYFYAFLQNKIAAYSTVALQFSYMDADDLQKAVIRHERLKAQVDVLTELLGELTPPGSQAESSETPE